MKYFDSNGNFKLGIKKADDICYQEDVDASNKERNCLLLEVETEVANYWKQFPADSDIVATYWVSRAASKMYDLCGSKESYLFSEIVFSNRE